VEAASGKTFETLDPATEESLGRVAHGAAEDIDRAVGCGASVLRRRALGLAAG
jgi:acyl-CoA reductase-like NAD-dependent aldehyde dehydrogenase